MRRAEPTLALEPHQRDVISENEVQQFIELARRDAALTHALRAALDQADIVKTIELGSELSGPVPTLAQRMLPEALQFAAAIAEIVDGVAANDDGRIVTAARRLAELERGGAARRKATA